MEFRIVPCGMDYDAAKNSADVLTSAKITPLVAGLSLITGYKIGESSQYLSSVLTTEDVDKLEYGSSIAVFSPTGAGKSWTIEQIALALSKDKQVIILTNRHACEIQLKQELSRKSGMNPIPAELLDNINISDNLKVMTYQKFVKICHCYNEKETVLFLDECHCFTEDAVFSTYPQQMIQFLHRNLDKTIRVYITATPEAVLPALWKLEAKDDSKLSPLTADNLNDFLRFTPVKSSTRIQMTYLMKSDWSYLTFKAYDPDNLVKLAEYLNSLAKDGKKSLIYINDIQKGKELQELLVESQHVYSDEDKKPELTEITENSRFDTSALITTKVAENGLSLHDEDLTNIIAETYDLTALQQIIGRARVSRKTPREITVLIPDYTASHLGSITGKIYMQIQEFNKAVNNPDFAMQYLPQPNPCIYYDALLKKPVVNEIGRQELQRQKDFVQTLRDEEAEQPHAFVRHVLEMYGKSTDNIDKIFIDYDNISDCKNRIHTAWETFKSSRKTDNDLNILKNTLMSACNETGAYGKELKSNIQINTINKILKFADIQDSLNPGETIFSINSPEENN